MSEITIDGKKTNIYGKLPTVGDLAPDFKAIDNDMQEENFSSYRGKKILLNIFPSLDTPICAKSIRAFNQLITQVPNSMVLCISVDLPFAQKRFCGVEGIHNAKTVSVFHNSSFGEDYGLLIAEGNLAGLLARAVIIVDEEGKVIYSELVNELKTEPNYEAAMDAF